MIPTIKMINDIIAMIITIVILIQKVSGEFDEDLFSIVINGMNSIVK